jgi:hypothetical protein
MSHSDIQPVKRPALGFERRQRVGPEKWPFFVAIQHMDADGLPQEIRARAIDEDESIDGVERRTAAYVLNLVK